MAKQSQTKKRSKRRLTKADLYALFVKPGDILFRNGEKVCGFSI